jgi:hypothetical protein
MEEVSFGLTVMAWNERSQFGPAWNGLKWVKSVLALPEWFQMWEVGFA